MGQISKYTSTQYPGVRYRTHKERKYNGKLDRYFSIRYKRDGKTVEESVGWASQGMNAQKATKIRSDIVQNIKLGKRPQSLREKRTLESAALIAEAKNKEQKILENYTFDQLGQKYIEWSKANKKSWRDDYLRYDLHLKPILGEKPLIKISSFDLEKLKSTLQKKKVHRKNPKLQRSLSPATVKHCLVLARQMFNKAIIRGLFNGPNPVKKIKLPKLNNTRLRFLSYQEAHLLLSKLICKSPQVHDQALIALHCGLRFGEIANLTLADLNFNNGIIQIRDPKGASRQAYMTDEVKVMLQTRSPSNASDFIFPGKNGSRQGSISNSFDRAVRDIGLNEGISDRRDKVVFHTLRHTFGSWLAIQGTPILTIKELMGHKTIEMTMRYAHLIPDQKIAAIKELSDEFSKFNSFENVEAK